MIVSISPERSIDVLIKLNRNPENCFAVIEARQLVHFYKADLAYGGGIAKKFGVDMEKYIPWTKLSLEELIKKTAE